MIFTGRGALAIDTYITSYMIKGELTVNNIFLILSEAHKRLQKRLAESDRSLSPCVAYRASATPPR